MDILRANGYGGSNESVQVAPNLRLANARRVTGLLAKRLAKPGFSLSSEKTWLVDFRRPDRRALASSFNDSDAGLRPGTFDLLGFTHYWAKSHNGYWVVKLKTLFLRWLGGLRWFGGLNRLRTAFGVRSSPPRTGAGVTGTIWFSSSGSALRQKVSGHFGYFAIIGNSQVLYCFRRRVGCVWRKWLSRGSQRAELSWVVTNRLLERYPLPHLRASPVT